MVRETTQITDASLQQLMKHFSLLRQKEHPSVMANPTKDKPSVIVIGAGMAGIAAANKLANAGLHVILTEARDRIGGRVLTLKMHKGTYIELGAQYLHGIKENPLFMAMAKYNVMVKPMRREKYSVFDENGKVIPQESLIKYIEQYKNEIKSLMQQRLSDTKDRFSAEEMKDILEQVEGTATLEEENLKELIKKLGRNEIQAQTLFHYKMGLDKTEGESNFIVTNGFGNMLNAMLKEAESTGNLEVHLNAEVTSIHCDAHQTVVGLKNKKSYQADAVICTVPLSVLQEGNIHFDPPLGDTKKSAIMRLKMANHNKVILFYRKVFWPNESHFVIPYDRTHQAWIDILNLNYFTDEETPVLAISIHESKELSHQSEKYILHYFNRVIETLFPKGYEAPQHSWVTHWEDEPFSLGAYCYHPEGSSLDDNTEIARPRGRLCFAGEHTHRAPASVQGAYMSGLEASKQVVDQLNKVLSVLS